MSYEQPKPDTHAAPSGANNPNIESVRRELARLQETFAGAVDNINARLGEIAQTVVAASSADMPQPARHAGDVALLKAAIEDLDGRRTQSDILEALVNRAASFAPRVVFFVVKNETASAWRARGLEGTVGDASVRDFGLKLTDDSILREAVASRQPLSGDADSYAANKNIYERLGSERPARAVAVPLVARNRAVAVLYADSATLDAEAINLEALEAMVRVAAMSVELLATNRPATENPRVIPAPAAFRYEPQTNATKSPSPDSTRTTSATTAELTDSALPVENDVNPESLNQHDAPDNAALQQSDFSRTNQTGQSGLTEVPSSLSLDEATEAPVPQPDLAMHLETDVASREAAFNEANTSSAKNAESNQSSSFDQPSPAASNAAAEVQQSEVVAPPAATPLASARRFGGNTELPIEVANDDEKRLHTDARRYARLLVSEIKLYNEQKVREGREARDLYERLKEAVDRSREMYDKRVRSEVTNRYDYFHQELVNTLAEGDASRLGATYKPATVAA